MRRRRLLLLLSLCLLGDTSQTPREESAKRTPLQKAQINFTSPAKYAKHLIKTDERTGKEEYYDPKPRVEILDERRGKIAFKWIAYDGTEKVVIYQRGDAIDAIVRAEVVRRASGQYACEYTIDNLASNSQRLSIFILQTISPDIKPILSNNGVVGPVASSDEMFSEGIWIYFGSSYIGKSITPGRSRTFRIESSAPPGVVGCRILGGDLGIKGGEDMPEELSALLPGYRIMPSGYTIGPVDNLKSSSHSEKLQYFRLRLAQFQKLGWMTASAVGWYEQNVESIDPERLRARGKADLRSETITSEVYAMIQFLTR